MRTFKNIAKALIVALVLAQSSSTLCAQEAAPFDGESVPGRVIEFGFDKEEWVDVIDWFAEQTGLSLGEVKSYPEGTFTLDDPKEYTPFEALDQLNFALGLQQPPYTIIRRNNELILIETTLDIPDVLIPRVTAEELDERGNFEVVTCKFHLGILDINEVEADLRALVPTKYTKYTQILPASNVFSASAPGEDLKNIRQTIEELTRAKKLTPKIYILNHYDPELFLAAARGPLKIAPESDSRDDDTLSINVDPSTGSLLVYATPSAHEAFTEIVELLDVPPTENGVGPERVYIKSYPITTDPAMARKVVETQLDGTTATIGQNDITGAIVLRGTKAQHDIADDVIKTIQGEAGSTKIVELQNASATSILEAINELLNIPLTPTENSNAPRLLANPSQNYIVIHGTPQQIFNVSEMIAQLDQASGRDPNRIRTNARVIELSPDKRDDLLESVEDRWPSTGRKNRLRIIQPGEKVQDKLKEERRTIIPRDASTSGKVSQRITVRTVAYQQQIEDSPEASSESVGSSYAAPEEATSVPGAELIIKATPFGVLLESDDLDALDDLEDIFRALAEDDGIDQGVTVFYLKFRKAPFIKAELDQMFGLSSGSGGGGDGGGIMGGLVDNMAGEGTGDLLGGLLGGSSMSSSGGAIELSGDVMIGQSVALNLLWVSGATSSDLDYIQDAIDLFDQASPPHNPELIGQFYSIPILHRSPQGVLDQVNTMMADQISGGPTGEGEKNGGGGQGGINEMAKMMRGMAGGGGGGNQNAAATEEAPKVRIGLDEETGQLLVVGPEFIYLQILKFVEEIDRPELSAPKSYEILSAELNTAGALEIIRMMFGPKIAVESPGGESEADASKQQNNGSNGKSAQGAAGSNAEATQQRAGLEALRNLQRGRNTANGGGGQRGGGGGQRGGGGGQRGGGGGGGQRGGGR